MRMLMGSILNKIGGGDRYFDNLLEKYGLDSERITWNGDGSIDYAGDVNFHDENLTKLPFRFNKVEGKFDCDGCINLLTLEGCPEVVGGYFSCGRCEKLKSLKGCPKKLGGWFDCSRCYSLLTLEGCQKVLNEGFSCYGCKSLLSLKGCPEVVGGSFYCGNCKNLTSLEGCPKEVGGFFNCRYCGRIFKGEEVKKHCKVKVAIFV